MEENNKYIQEEINQVKALEKLGFEIEVNPNIDLDDDGSPNILLASLKDKEDKLRVVVTNSDPFKLALSIIKSYQVHAKFLHKRTMAYEKLIDLIKDETNIPPLIVEHPEFILGQTPSEYDIKWAKELVAKFKLV